MGADAWREIVKCMGVIWTWRNCTPGEEGSVSQSGLKSIYQHLRHTDHDSKGGNTFGTSSRLRSIGKFYFGGESCKDEPVMGDCTEVNAYGRRRVAEALSADVRFLNGKYDYFQMCTLLINS